MAERGSRSGKGALPEIIIIGAPKCGTTSLHYYLDLHPAIAMTREKELHFFSKPHVWERGLEWYRSQFDAAAELRGEASISYSVWPRWTGVPERMASVIPHARLLYIVRDPIQRIISSWMHRYADGTESRPIASALEVLENNAIVDRSRYYTQIEQYLGFFPRSQIHVICSERLLSDRRAVLAEIFRFVGADPTFDTPGFDRVEHESRRKRRKGVIGRILTRLAESPPPRIVAPAIRRRIGYVVYRPFTRAIEPPTLDERTQERVREYLAPDIARMREFTGQAFAEWSV
jgi:hypothetical protein